MAQTCDIPENINTFTSTDEVPYLIIRHKILILPATPLLYIDPNISILPVF